MEEVWKDVVGYVGYYQISNLGNIRSLDRYVNARNNGVRICYGKLLKTHLNKDGYVKIQLGKNKEIKKITYSIHRLVAIAFIPNTNNYPQINHKNGVKTENYPNNLEWCNAVMNCQHARDSGLSKPLYGKNNKNSKLTEKDVLEIRNLYSSGKYTQRKLAKMFNVAKNNIWCILKRETWKYI